MVADVPVGSGSSVICFSIAWLVSEPFLACFGITYAVNLCLDCVCRCDLGIVLHTTRDIKCILSYDSVLLS